MHTSEPTECEPRPIGGWLILVGLSLIVWPVRTLSEIAVTYPQLFLNGGWERLTAPASESYHPLWAPLLIADAAFAVALSIAAYVLFYLFVEKSRRFPKLYVAWLITAVSIMVLSEVAMAVSIPAMATLDSDTASELARALIACAIWIPYMYKSKRVQQTFVRTAA